MRFVGEPMAVIVADSPYAAEDAAELIEATLDPLPAVVDPLAAADAAAIHDHPTNILFDTGMEAGDVDGAFAEAAVIVERTFRSPRYSATPMESRAAIAAPDGDGVRVWASTQIPHRLAEVISDLLHLDPARVRVSTMDVGGGFGQKAHAYPEEILTAWLALELARPVKWVEDRSENLLASSHARDQVVRVRVAADGQGRLQAIDADVICDTGAYGVFPHGHILEAMGTSSMIPGPYRLANYRMRARSVATNKGPEGAYRGVGLPVSVFVHERTMDILAAELGLDRAEIRRRNLLSADELPHTTVTHHRYDSGDYALALERALQGIGYPNFATEREAASKRGNRFGLGIATYVEYSGMGSVIFHGRGMVGIAGHDSAHMRVGEDGRVTVWTSLPGIGQGVATTFAQLTAHGLGMDVDDVIVARSDTDAGEGGGTGTFASRSAVSGGGAVAAAAEDLRARLLDAAADHLEASRDDLEIVDGSVAVRGSPSRGVPVAELAAGNGERFAVSRRLRPGEDRLPVRHPRRGRRGRPRHRPRRAPALRGGRGLRHGHQPADRRGPGPRRHRPGHRRRAVRVAGLRRRRPAPDHVADGLPRAHGDGAAGGRDRPPRDPLARLGQRRQGRRRGRHAGPDGGDRQRRGRRAGGRVQRAPAHARARARGRRQGRDYPLPRGAFPR